MVYQRAKERHGVEAMAWAVARGAATSRKRVNECTPQDNEDPVLDRGLPDRFIVQSSGRFKVGDYAQLIDSNLRLTKGIFGLRVRRDTGLYAPRGKSRAGVGTDGKIARLFYLGERQERNGSLTE